MPQRIELTNEQSRPVDREQLLLAANRIVESSDFSEIEISIAIVDDPTMHQLNRQYLDHDYPTDVLSFPLERDVESGKLQGEIIVSADTAFVSAEEYGWEYGHELLLYVIHGMLHLVGFDDKTDEDRQQMREAESRFLARFGIERK